MQSRKFFSVSTITDASDEQGCTVTFETIEQAEAYASWARDQGMLHVTIFS
jgi:hypothetical protein